MLTTHQRDSPASPLPAAKDSKLLTISNKSAVHLQKVSLQCHLVMLRRRNVFLSPKQSQNANPLRHTGSN